MLLKFREAFEFRACILALLILRLSAIYWLVVLVAKFFTREPLLYHYSLAAYTHETVPVAAVLVVQTIAVLYQLLTRTAFGRPADSYVLLERSPWIAAFATVVFWMWAESKPASGSSYLPLAALTSASFFCAIVVRWGPMARDSRRRKTAVEASRAQEEGEAIATATRPTRSFADIAGHGEIKARLLAAATAVQQSQPKRGASPPRNGVLLYGEPGNGKTVFAEAIAGELRLPLLTLSYSDVASRWVGEKTSRVRQVFDEAIRQQPCVLFLDEVDRLDCAGDARQVRRRRKVNQRFSQRQWPFRVSDPSKREALEGGDLGERPLLSRARITSSQAKSAEPKVIAPHGTPSQEIE